MSTLTDPALLKAWADACEKLRSAFADIAEALQRFGFEFAPRLVSQRPASPNAALLARSRRRRR